jgi:hypothetical protein
MTDADPAPTPERPRDAGVAETEPDELGALEGARVLENDAREQLSARGFDDEQIRKWADAYIERFGAGDVEQFVAWIEREEHGGTG